MLSLDLPLIIKGEHIMSSVPIELARLGAAIEFKSREVLFRHFMEKFSQEGRPVLLSDTEIKRLEKQENLAVSSRHRQKRALFLIAGGIVTGSLLTGFFRALPHMPEHGLANPLLIIAPVAIGGLISIGLSARDLGRSERAKDSLGYNARLSAEWKILQHMIRENLRHSFIENKIAISARKTAEERKDKTFGEHVPCRSVTLDIRKDYRYGALSEAIEAFAEPTDDPRHQFKSAMRMARALANDDPYILRQISMKALAAAQKLRDAQPL
jgi:hypothetical protein